MEDGGEILEDAWKFVRSRSLSGCNTRSIFTGASSTVCSVVESVSGANEEIVIEIAGSEREARGEVRRGGNGRDRPRILMEEREVSGRERNWFGRDYLMGCGGKRRVEVEISGECKNPGPLKKA